MRYFLLCIFALAACPTAANAQYRSNCFRDMAGNVTCSGGSGYSSPGYSSPGFSTPTYIPRAYTPSF